MLSDDRACRFTFRSNQQYIFICRFNRSGWMVWDTRYIFSLKFNIAIGFSVKIINERPKIVDNQFFRTNLNISWLNDLIFRQLLIFNFYFRKCIFRMSVISLRELITNECAIKSSYIRTCAWHLRAINKLFRTQGGRGYVSCWGRFFSGSIF